MTGAVIGFKKLAGRVSSSFRLGARVATTYSADAYRVEGRLSQAGDVLWKTRDSLCPTFAEKFLSRLELLTAHPAVAPIIQYGIDGDNVGYALINSSGLIPILSQGVEGVDAETLFTEATLLVESLHARNITCGDISQESFAVRKDGRVVLFAPLGDPETEAEGDESLRLQHVRFRLPAQRAGAPTPKEDVYALCQVALKVDRGQGDLSANSTTRVALANLLKADAAGESDFPLESVQSLRVALQKEGVELPPARELSTDDTAGGKTREVTLKLGRIPEVRQSGEGLGRRGLRHRLIGSSGGTGLTRVLVLLNLCALGLLVWLIYAPTKSSAFVPFEQRQSEVEFFNRLVMSDDPLAHGKLEKEFRESITPERRALALRAMMARSRRLGLLRGADVVLSIAQQRGVGGGTEIPPELAFGISVLDPLKSNQAKRELLSSSYSSSPQFVTSLAAALALDSKDSATYHDIFVRAAEEQLAMSQAAGKNDLALMLLIPDVHDLFSEDLVLRGEELSAEDVKFLLSEMARRERCGIATVAQLAAKKGVSAELGTVFLRELQRSSGLEPKVRAALVSGALGNFSEGDVDALAEWYAPGSARALEAAILSSQDPTIRKKAFEALRSKPLGDGYVSGVFEFIQATYGADSERFAPLVATLALREVAAPAVIKGGLSVVPDAPSNRKLAQRIIRKAPGSVVLIALPELHTFLEPTDLTDLLAHPEKAVRLQALPYLSSANDILVLKLIQQAYEQEQDEEVRRAYQDNIATIRGQRS